MARVARAAPVSARRLSLEHRPGSASAPGAVADMCGIVGMLTFGAAAPLWRGQIEHAMDLMARRGPDASGLWSDGDRCLLGFRRLSILDLSRAGNQPMLTRDGRYALVFNGELYNFREIRKTLQDRGVSFRSTGDAEVVLYALAEFGEAALESFNGMFALAFYDTVARRLLLARDHAAIKPLYVLRHPDGLLFALPVRSDPLASLGAAQQCESRGARTISQPRLHPRRRSPCWRALRHSKPAPGCRWTEAGERQRDATSPSRAIRVTDLTERGARGGGCGDRIVGTTADGERRSGRRPALRRHRLAARGGGHAAGDECVRFPPSHWGPTATHSTNRPTLGRYAKALGLHHVVQHIAPADVLGLLDDVVAAYTEPHDDYSIFPTALISRVARDQVTVALSGDGGDDIFWGYPERMIRPLRGDRGCVAGMARGAHVASIGPRLTETAPLTADRRARRNSPKSLRGRGQLQSESFPRFRHSPTTSASSASTARGFDAARPMAPMERVHRPSGAGAAEGRPREHAPFARGARAAARPRGHRRRDARGLAELCRFWDGKWASFRCGRRSNAGSGSRPCGNAGSPCPMASWLRGPLRPLFEDLVLSRQSCSDFR